MGPLSSENLPTVVHQGEEKSGMCSQVDSAGQSGSISAGSDGLLPVAADLMRRFQRSLKADERGGPPPTPQHANT